MRVSYNKCEHCGKRLEDHTDYIEVDIDTKKLRFADLCSDCFEELDRIVERFLNPDSQELE
jgi:hypothetical protein